VKVLVTGASGFLGRAVVTALLDRGHAVRVLLRPSASRTDLPWASDVEVVRADLRSSPDLEETFEGVNAVAHLAARAGGDPVAQFQGTVVGTERLLHAMRGSDVRRLLLVSSISVYDWRAPRGALVEEGPLEPSMYTRDGYAISKIWQEKVCRRYASDHALDLVVLRPGFIWGRGREWIDGVGVRLGNLLLVNGPFRRLPLTHVDNCADAVAAALESEAASGGIFNVFDSDEIRAWRFASDYLKRGTGGCRAPFPYAAGLLAAGVASAIGRLLLGPRAKLPGILVPQRYRARFRSLRFPNTRLRETLGWTPPHSYEESLRRTHVRRPAPPRTTCLDS
jgi:UDP-glucose 4-epimerase